MSDPKLKVPLMPKKKLMIIDIGKVMNKIQSIKIKIQREPGLTLKILYLISIANWKVNGLKQDKVNLIMIFSPARQGLI